MEKKAQEKIGSEWFKQLINIGVSLKSFEYYNCAPDLGREELFLIDKFTEIIEEFLKDQSDERLSTALKKLKTFSLSSYSGFMHSVKHHSSYGHKLYMKEWTLAYVLLGQLKIIQMKYPEVADLIMELTLSKSSLLDDYKFFIFTKTEISGKSSKTMKIEHVEELDSSQVLKQAKEKIKKAQLSQKLQKDYLKAHRLCNEIIEYFVDCDNQKELKQKGMTVTASLDELKLIRTVASNIQERIECTLILQEQDGDYKEVINFIPKQSSGCSSKKIDTTKIRLDESKKRSQALFERIVKQFTEIEDKSKILEKGLVVEARPNDYPLLLAIKDEISQIIKCEVYIREKKYDEKKSLGDTIVSMKF